MFSLNDKVREGQRESRNYYDEHAKHDEASTKASETNGKKSS